MNIKIAAVGVAAAGLLSTGLALAPAASASTSPAKVGSTVFKHGTWHKYEATYKLLPSTIALLQPSSRKLAGVVWDSRTATGGLANGIELSGIHSGGGAAVSIQVSRPRNGHFTRMTVQASGGPQKFWWPAVIKRSTVREWRASN